jgi:hypothetical protein
MHRTSSHQHRRRAIFVRRHDLTLAIVVSTLGLGLNGGVGVAHKATSPGLANVPAQRSTVNVGSAFDRMLLAFEPNRGQAPPQVRYLAHGPGYLLMLGASSVTFQMSSPTSGNVAATSCCSPLPATRAWSHAGADAAGRFTRASVRFSFLGHHAAHLQLVAQRRLPGIVNYLIGNDPKRWRTRIPTYARVTYQGIYPHIDLTVYGIAGRPEYDWIIRPGGDPRSIEMAFQGAQSPRLDRQGNLLLTTPLGTLRQQAPRVYQPGSTVRQPVGGGFRLLGQGRVGFRLGAYDEHRALVIDPSIAYSTFFGGPASFLVPEGIAVDPDGNAYVTGSVEGTIPITNPTFQAAQSGPEDAFVAKLDPTGTFFFYSTYLGGSGNDTADAIAVDTSGYAYVCGGTTSTDFPLLPNGQIGPNGVGAFVVRVRPAGYSLAYSYATVDNNGANCAAVAADQVVQATFAASFNLPSTQLATSFATVTQLDAAGKYIRSFNTLSKGAAIDTGPTVATGIALGPQGDVAFTGYTTDTQLPVKNPIQLNASGGRDAFVFLLDRQLNVEWGTFWGGNLDDVAIGTGIDANDNVYIAGYTQSKNFPTVNALQSSLAGSHDAFAAEFSSSGQSVAYSTYFGGHEMGSESIGGMAVDLYGNIYLTGGTDSRDFPIVTGNQVMPGPSQIDAYVSEIGFGGKPLVFSTFFGGSNVDAGHAIAVDATGAIYVTGTSSSLDLPTSQNAAQPLFQGQSAAFIAKLIPSMPLPMPTPTGTGNGFIGAADTATATPTATPTSTPVATHTPTAVPPPETPVILVKSSQIRSGRTLKLTVITSPDADVTATLTVKHAKTLRFKATAGGVADSSGHWRGSIKIDFNPGTRAKATITVQARTAGGTAVNSTIVTILHHG